MYMQQRNWNPRIFLLVLAATLIGAATAALALGSTAGVRNDSTLRPLVWVVFGTPLATFTTWFLLRPSQRWQAAFGGFMTYFWCIVIAARIERIVLGPEGAQASKHVLYFQLTIALNVLAGSIAALRAAQTRGTIPTTPMGHVQGESGDESAPQRQADARSR